MPITAYLKAFYSCMTPVALSGLNAGLLLITCRILLDGNRFEKFPPNLAPNVTSVNRAILIYYGSPTLDDW